MFLHENGFNTQIVNLAVKRRFHTEFKLDEFIRDEQPMVVGISLQWHMQLADAVDTARLVKTQNPQTKVVVGGMTATIFAEDLLKDYPFIDFVIRGDGEVPFLNLSQELYSQQERYASIPNLVWRDEDKRAQFNPVSYVNDVENTQFMSHVRLDLMRDAKIYVGEDLQFDIQHNPKNVFYYHFGKGCKANCTFCGGGSKAHKDLYGRKSYFFYDNQKILRDLHDLQGYGVNTLRVCFDPDPQSDRFVEIFKAIKRNKHLFRMLFECFGLPDDAFLDAFKDTFRDDSTIMISPMCGSDSVRRRMGGFIYSNAELHDCVSRMTQRGIRVSLFFTFGLPFEKMEDLEATQALMVEMQKLGASCFSLPLEPDPSSPMLNHPEDFGVTEHLSSLADYVAYARRAETDQIYRTEWLSKEQILTGLKRLESIETKVGDTSTAWNASLLAERRSIENPVDQLREIKAKIDIELNRKRRELALLSKVSTLLRPVITGRKKLRSGFKLNRIVHREDGNYSIEWIRESQMLVVTIVLDDFTGPVAFSNGGIGIIYERLVGMVEADPTVLEIERDLMDLVDLFAR